MKDYLNIGRIIRATRYSMDGLKAAFQSEAAFRQELALCIVLIPLALWLAPDHIGRALMIGSLFLVLITELLNSAVEAVVDKTGTDIHPLSKKAKDIGSAAVFIALLNVGITWFFVLF